MQTSSIVRRSGPINDGRARCEEARAWPRRAGRPQCKSHEAEPSRAARDMAAGNGIPSQPTQTPKRRPPPPARASRTAGRCDCSELRAILAPSPLHGSRPARGGPAALAIPFPRDHWRVLASPPFALPVVHAGARLGHAWRSAHKDRRREAARAMPGMQSYSARATPWDDREALLDGAVQGASAKAGDDDKPPIHPLRMRAFFVAAVLTVFTSSLGILTTLSQTSGGYKYDYATIPFLAELLKFLICGYLLWKEFKAPQSAVVTTKWSSILLYPIPSIIYLVHNNVQFLTLTYVDTSTHQIMGNLKIVTTGILFRTFLKRKLSRLQWMAIILLTIGTTVSQVKGCGETNCGRLLAAPIQGYLLGILSACLSALAGVYTEYLMKKNQDSLYWQNMQLYSFGVLFNIARLTVDDVRAGFSKGPWWYRLFNGYDIVTWLVVLNLGCTGLLVSWIMKYADNIVKVYATSMAMLLTMVISIELFNFKPTLQLFLGILICCMSLQLYYTPVESLVGAPTSPPSPPTEASSTLDSENDTKRKSLS